MAAPATDPFDTIPDVPNQAFKLGGFMCRGEDAYKSAHVVSTAMSVIMKASISRRDTVYAREEAGKILVEFADQGDYEQALQELKALDEELERP